MDALDDLPGPAARRVALQVTPAALRAVRAGHPWVWDESIVRASGDLDGADLAVVFDRRDRFAAIGLWEPDAPIACRILHAGDPTPIDQEFFATALDAALERRQALRSDPGTTGWRVVHGENDRLPGLVIDRFDRTAVVRLDTAAWLPHLPTIVPLVCEQIGIETVVLRSSRRTRSRLPAELRESTLLLGPAPDGPVPFLENGLTFFADVTAGQKTGWFLDQRDNRKRVQQLARGARVLDVFCNAGGFGVHAAAGGADHAHFVDSSRTAAALAARHVEANRAAFSGRFTSEVSVVDAFDQLELLGRRRKRFDLVIIDPPSFAPNAAAVPAALRSYLRLASLGADLVSPGGTLVQASCSSRVDAADFERVVRDGIAATRRHPISVERTDHAVDHPIGFTEGAYLKAVFANLS